MNLSSKTQSECRNGHHHVDNMSFKTLGTAINEVSSVGTRTLFYVTLTPTKEMLLPLVAHHFR